MVRDELAGFFANLERTEFQSERAFYLEAFNGDGQFTYDRIGRGTIYIPNVTLSMIGGIQPSRITPIIQAMHCGKNNDGLIQRFQMLVWPDVNQDWKLVDRAPNQKARQDYEAMFRSFLDKPLGAPDNPLIMRFAPNAQEYFYEWLESLYKMIKEEQFSESYQSHILKMPKTITTLALIFELVEGGRFEIGLPSLSMALRWSPYLLSHAKRLYAAGNIALENHANLLVERCDHLADGFTVRDVYKRHWKLLKDTETIKQTLELLCRCNYLREIYEEKSPKGGRPTKHYEWHPLVKNHRTTQ